MLAIAYELRTEGMTGAEREDFDAWLHHDPMVLQALASVPDPTPPTREQLRESWGRGPAAAQGVAALMGAVNE